MSKSHGSSGGTRTDTHELYALLLWQRLSVSFPNFTHPNQKSKKNRLIASFLAPGSGRTFFQWDAHCGICSGHEVPVSGLRQRLTARVRGSPVGTLITTIGDCFTYFFPAWHPEIDDLRARSCRCLGRTRGCPGLPLSHALLRKFCETLVITRILVRFVVAEAQSFPP